VGALGVLGVRYAVAVCFALLAACTPLIHTPGIPDPADAWPMALTTARNRAATGNFDGADSTLAQFSRTYPGAPHSLEALYWRALFKMDPANRTASLPSAMTSLDAYLADPRPRDHVPEATTLRRVAQQLDGMNKVAVIALEKVKDAQATAATANAAAANAKDVARDATAKAADATASATSADEVKHLKDELAKATAELDRIRKRLSAPSKPFSTI
jgi:hypothetical protein